MDIFSQSALHKKIIGTNTRERTHQKWKSIKSCQLHLIYYNTGSWSHDITLISSGFNASLITCRHRRCRQSHNSQSICILRKPSNSCWIREITRNRASFCDFSFLFSSFSFDISCYNIELLIEEGVNRFDK